MDDWGGDSDWGGGGDSDWGGGGESSDTGGGGEADYSGYSEYSSGSDYGGDYSEPQIVDSWTQYDDSNNLVEVDAYDNGSYDTRIVEPAYEAPAPEPSDYVDYVPPEYAEPTSPESNVPTWEQYLASHPATPQQQTTPWWDYNVMLAEQNPYAPAWANIYGGAENIPPWLDINQNPWPGTGPESPYWDQIQQDIEAYRKQFNVGGLENILPGGSMIFGPNRAYTWQELTASSTLPQWERDMMTSYGQIWNPYTGQWELSWDAYVQGLQGGGYAPYAAGPRYGGGGGGGEPYVPRELRPGTPEYEALNLLRRRREPPITYERMY